MEITVNDANFEKEVLKSEMTVLVDFWAEWCNPCKMIAPSIAEISNEYFGKLKVCKLNVDEAQQTAMTYDIQGIPTMAIFKGGKLTGKIVGAMPKQAIIKALQQYL